MNIKRLQASACALVLASMGGIANAASVSVVAPGSVAPGASFSVTLEGDFTDVGLFGGGVEFSWDDSLLSLDSIVLNPEGELNALDGGLSCPGAGFCPPAGAGSVVLGFSPSGANVLGLATGTLASLSFTSNGSPGLASFGVADDLAVFGGLADLTGTPIAVDYVGADTSMVPVPAAVWLFGSGLLGLVGVARRRKAA